MRNLVEYPITVAEVQDQLNDIVTKTVDQCEGMYGAVSPYIAHIINDYINSDIPRLELYLNKIRIK